MIEGLINNKKAIVFVVLAVIVLGGVNLIMKFDTAKEFDKYNQIMLMGTVILFAVMNQFSSVKEMTMKLFLVGLIAFVVSLIAYNIYDNLNKYFSFEMNGYTWNGLAGFIGFLICWIQAYLCSLIVYFAKLKCY